MNALTFERKNTEKIDKVIPYNHRLAPLFIRDRLYSMIPEGTKHLYIVGIGSSRISGDSLGPFVGTLLEGLYPSHITVSGTLKYPLDAETIVPEISQITIPRDCYVVAIDSVFGSEQKINSIMVREGALCPGEALGNDLPLIGNCSVMGVVHENVPAEKQSLLLTDLNLIYTMAIAIAKGISLTARQYFQYPSNHPLLLLQ